MNRYLIYKTSGVDASLLKIHPDQYQQKMDKRLQELTLSSTSSSNQVVPASSMGLIRYEDSITYKLSSCLADAALFNARRFRINWSASPNASTFVQLVLPSPNAGNPQNLSLQTSFMSSIQITTPNMFSKIGGLRATTTMVHDINTEKVKVMRDNCDKYLTIQLEQTDFVAQPADESESKKLPLLRPKHGNELIRRCCECVTELRNNIG